LLDGAPFPLAAVGEASRHDQQERDGPATVLRNPQLSHLEERRERLTASVDLHLAARLLRIDTERVG